MRVKDSKFKSQFPIYEGHPGLAYFDTAASSLTPQVVIDAANKYYTEFPVNIHRGVYQLADEATQAYESARKNIAGFLNADEKEIIFTSGTTQGLNMLAGMLKRDIRKGDNIVLTRYEHHANILPWQRVAKEQGAELRFIELTDEFEIDIASAKRYIDKKTKIVSFANTSHTLGTIAPAEQLIKLAKQVGAQTILDAAQEIAHAPIDVRVLDSDFVVFSGHKMYGPTGIGVLYGKSAHLERLEPYVVGGGMIQNATYEDATWAEIPAKFEAGTPDIAGAIGLSAAVDFVRSIGFEKLQAQESALTQKMLECLDTHDARIIGPRGESRRGVVSFLLGDVHPHDVAEIFSRHDVAVRAGNHCTEPLMQYLNLPLGTVRLSLGVYNTMEDVSALDAAIADAKKILYGR